MTRLLSIPAAMAIVVASLGIFASPAAAHERRAVGPYSFVVGWAVEPAYANQVNGLELIVSETATTKPVEGLEKTLKVEIIAGGGSATKELTLEPKFGAPGRYEAKVLPTRTGDYTFHISGTAGTTKIDERFESGPGRFDGIVDSATIQFPSGATDVATRLDENNTKLTATIAIAAVALGLSLLSLALARRR